MILTAAAKFVSVSAAISSFRDWNAFEAWAGGHLTELSATRGRGLAILVEPSASPVSHALLKQLRGRFPERKLYEHTSWSRVNERRGSELTFDRPCRPLVDLNEARVIVCLDDDLIGRHPNAIRHARRLFRSSRSRCRMDEPAVRD